MPDPNRLTPKEANEYCRSSLQSAIRSIEVADAYWDCTPDAVHIVAELRRLKARVKSEIGKTSLSRIQPIAPHENAL